MLRALSTHVGQVWRVAAVAQPLAPALAVAASRAMSTDAADAAKKPRRRRRKSDAPRRQNPDSPLSRPVQLSPALTAFMGESSAAPTQVVKALWAHIKANNLQNPENKREIVCDATLRALFPTERMTMFEMPKLLQSHFIR